MMEMYELPEGNMLIGFCDESLSIGLLTLNPRQQLQKHNRPVKEELVQIEGTCVMKLFDGAERVRNVTLHEGDRLEIQARQFHVHSNPKNDISITLWKFEGDIVKIIGRIRGSSRKIA